MTPEFLRRPYFHPLRTIVCEEWVHVASLVINSGAARECLMEDHDCRFYLDGCLCDAQTLVKVTQGSFFRVIISQHDQRFHSICDCAETADDLNFLMQLPRTFSMEQGPELQTVRQMNGDQFHGLATDQNIRLLPFRTWFRATVWLNLERLNHVCHSISTSVIFRVPTDAPWEPLALQALASSIPFSVDRQNGKACRIVWPQPAIPFRSAGVHQLIVTDYWPQPNDFPVLIDNIGTTHLERAIMHFWSISGNVEGTAVAIRRNMMDTCQQEGWCFIRYRGTEFELSDLIALTPFSYMELVFVPFPQLPNHDSECETTFPDDITEIGSPVATIIDSSGDAEDELFLLQCFVTFRKRPTPLMKQIKTAHERYDVLQSLIVLLRLPPPGNGMHSKRSVNFDPYVAVFDSHVNEPVVVYDMKMTNDYLAEFVSTTDHACENPLVLGLMTQFGWASTFQDSAKKSPSKMACTHATQSLSGPTCVSKKVQPTMGLTLCLDDLIPQKNSGELAFRPLPDCRPMNAFQSFSLCFDLQCQLGLEVPWASDLRHTLEGLDLHPFTLIALDICPSRPLTDLKAVHVYTDGSFFDSKITAGVFHPANATWSFVVLGEHPDGTFAYIGYLAGDVITESDSRWETSGIGASRHDPLTAERCALYWAIAWGHHLASTHPTSHPAPAFHLHFDCLAAGWEASGTHGPTIDSMSILAIATRSLAIRLETKLDVHYHHVHGHCGQPWNEFADAAARSRAKQKIDDLTPAHFLSPLRTNVDFLTWSTSVTAAPSGFDSSQDTQTLWLRGFDAGLPTSFKWTPFAANPQEPPKTCAFKGLVASYNVMSLKKKGTLELLRLQCSRKGLHIIGLQETRDRTSQFWSQGSYFRFTSAADAQGQGGLQLWISRDTPFLFVQGAPLHLTPKAFTVVVATPRLLRVHCHVGGLHLVFIVAHAPHSSSAHADDWWQELRSSCADIRPEAHQILMIDANCRLQGFDDSYVGPFGPPIDSQHQDSSDDMHQFLIQQNLFVPSTFDAFHRGTHYTWHLGSGHARLDYVALPHSWNVG